jgi:autotransporter-associated beta strand protein
LLINAGAYVEMAGGSCVINGLSQSTNNPGGMVYNGWGSLQTVTLGNGDASASYSGVISGGGSGIALVKVGTGTQTLSGANTYAGGTTLSNGVLSVSSLSNIGGASANVTFAGGTLQINGTAFTSFGATPLTFTSAGGGLDIVDAGNTLTLTNNLSSGTVLTKTGAGTLSLTGTQAGTVTTDDPTKISFGSGLGFYNLGVTTNGVLSPAGSGMIGTFAVTNNLTLAGKLLVDVTASTNDMVTAGGSIALSAGATLEVVNTSLLNRSKQYTLMTSVGSVSGTFASSNLPARWKVGAFGNAVVLYYVNPGTMVRIF